MGERQLNRARGLIAIVAGLGGFATACSKDEPAPASPASVGKTQVFQFAPPDGTEFVRSDKRTQEIAIVGAPLRRTETEELRWHVSVERTGDEYLVNQDLVYISLGRDGQTLAEGEMQPGISAKLVIDKQGTLTSVKGLERTAEILRSAVAPGKEAEAQQAITTDSLVQLVAARYRILFGETIGRQASPGSSWTITNPPGSFVVSRTVTVTGHEACGSATCARLQVDFQLDPKMFSDSAVSVFKSGLSAADKAKVTVQNANYRMSGWMLVEPATMLSHGASLTEGGTVTVVDGAQKLATVELKGTTDISYSYNGARTSELPSRAEPRVASE